MDDCELCDGREEVEITTASGYRDCFGCPACIAMEMGEQIEELRDTVSDSSLIVGECQHEHKACVYCEGTGIDPESFCSLLELPCPACSTPSNA